MSFYTKNIKGDHVTKNGMDLVRTKYRQKYNHIPEYTNTNIQKITINTTKYMKQVRSKVRELTVLSISAFDRQRQIE